MADDSGQVAKAALVDALLRVPVMQEMDGRALVLAELADRGYRLDPMRFPRDRHDIWAIVTASLRQPGALGALIEILRGIEGEHLAVSETSRIAGRLTAVQSSRRLSDGPASVNPAVSTLESFILALALKQGESASVVPEVRRERLHCGTELGAGGRGRVFSLLSDPGLVYKEYISKKVNGGALAELIIQRNMFGEADKEIVDTGTSWPLARVIEGRRIIGCIMRALPDAFYITASAGRQPAYLSYLCYPPKRSWADIGIPGVSDRLEIARQVLNLIALLQRYSLVIGDISARNILWKCDTAPRVFLLSCDALRILGSPSALPEGETPGWEDPAPWFPPARHRL